MRRAFGRYGYQTYVDAPTNLTFTPESSFHCDDDNASSITVLGAGVVTARFAQEAACWIEFNSTDLEAAGGAVDVSISESVSFTGETK